MRILVTGGAGFIGKHLVSALIKEGHDVVVFDNLRRADRTAVPSGAEFVQGDIRDRDTLQAAVRGCSHVFHLAAQSNVIGAVTDVDYSFSTNVVGTYNVLTTALKEGVSKVVFASSREVYGDVRRLPVSEAQPSAAKNAYGASKVAGEAYCQVFEANHGLQTSIIRLANVYGPGDHDRVIPLWLDHAAKGEPLDLYGGEQILDFVAIDVVIQALLRASHLALGGMPINVGAGRGTSLRDLASRIAELPGANVQLRVHPARSVEVVRFTADVTRMRTILEIEPPTDPLIGLPQLWDETTSHLTPR